MVSRAVLDVGESLDGDDAPGSPGQPSASRRPPGGAHWRGAGGRWLVWAGRAVVWAVLIIVGYRGVLAIATGSGTGSGPGSGAATAGTTTAFPETLAQAFALQFGSVYLNYSPSTAASRSQQLSRFLPPGTASQLGWNGAGTERLVSEQVASVSVTGSHTAVVTLLARLGSGRMVELGVPVYADKGAMSVSGEPALLPAPSRAVLPARRTASSDPAAQAALRSQLPAFFQAFASGDRATLARFTWPGTHLTGLAGAVRFGGIDSLYAPAGGARRNIVVTVTWDLASAAPGSGNVATAPASLQMTYQLKVVEQHGSWDVQAIGASPEAQGPP
jgi:Conjugative transposon protein TcpC